MLKPIMTFAPTFRQYFVPDDSEHPDEQRYALEMLRDPRRQAVESLLAAKGSMEVIYLEIDGFNLLAELYGAEVSSALLEVMAREGEVLAAQRFAGLPLSFVEGLGGNGLVVVLGRNGQAPDDAMQAALSFRLELRARMRQAVIQLTGQAPDIRVGAAKVLYPPTESYLDHALAAAVVQAQRLARSGPGQIIPSLLNEFRSLVENRALGCVFQPIVDLRNGQIFAWEALARGPAGSHFESPGLLFDFAEEAGAIFALEKVCRETAIRHYGPHDSGRKLFLNVHPRTLLDPSFTPGETHRLLAKYGMTPQDVVLEVTERHSVRDFNLFHRTLQHYRQAEFQVAVDDVGTGYAGLWSLAEIRPEFIKIDMSLIRGLDTHPVKRALLETLLTFSEKVGSRIIAEGIETEVELSALIRIGIPYGQGFFLARPALPKPLVTMAAAATIASGANTVAALKCSTPISELIEPSVQFAPSNSVSEVKQFFDTHEHVQSVVIIRDEAPVGLVMSHHLDRTLSSQYGLALFLKREVSKVMDAMPLTLDWQTPVELAAQAAMTREKVRLYDPILVVKTGRLLGQVSVQKMLDALACVQVEMAKGANPLTGLPGNVAIEREFARRSGRNIPSSFLYVDLDNFKVYNDVYGFQNGDQAILLSARILTEAVQSAGTPDDFLGHVGGDDFVIICARESAAGICEAAVKGFEAAMPSLYNQEDRDRGFILGRGRDGREGHFPLISASIGMIDCVFQVPVPMDELGQRAAEVKKFAKSVPGNSWVRDRRLPLGQAPGGFEQ